MKTLVLVFLLLLVAAVGVAVLGVFLSDVEGPLARAAVLEVRLDQPLLDHSQVPRVPLLELEPPLSLATLFRALDRARHDDDVRGVSLHVQRAAFGLGKAQQLRRLLDTVSEAGKFVECYLETAGEMSNGTLAYYLVSACDRISISPAGHVNLLGLYADSLFLRGTLDKLRIDPQFATAGEYKNADEFFTAYGHSPAAREELEAVLDDLYEQIVGDVAADRGLAPAAVRGLVDRAPLDAEAALAAGLVDAVAFPDEFEARIEELAGEEPSRLTPADYAGRGPRRGHRLAVFFAQGAIVRGRGGVDPWSGEIYLGADELRRVVRDLAEDSKIAAVVLRIDSPGGSALASDLMLRELERLAEAKPLIVSMSDLAASGGYYIAAKAQTIVAEPATITGSIGVVAGKLVIRRFHEELLGLGHDPLQRGANAGIFSATETLTPLQAERFQELVDGTYSRFIGHVAEGRGMATEAVDAVAKGRIWSGARALELGLVDETGGLERALALAAEASGLEPGAAYEYFPKPRGLADLLFGDRHLRLPPGLRELELLVAPPTPGLLELPPELKRLSRPF